MEVTIWEAIVQTREKENGAIKIPISRVHQQFVKFDRCM